MEIIDKSKEGFIDLRYSEPVNVIIIPKKIKVDKLNKIKMEGKDGKKKKSNQEKKKQLT